MTDKLLADVLVHQIESDLYNRQGKAITNFKQTLPKMPVAFLSSNTEVYKPITKFSEFFSVFLQSDDEES